jgi:putative transcriptional regulator
MKSLAPNLMLAMPALDGSWFGRTVILLLKHDAEGSFGLVINRPVDDHMSADLLDILAIDEPLITPGLLLGGPMSPETALVIHRQSQLGEDSEEVVPGLYVASQRESLAKLCDESQRNFWILMGYAGWGGGQLEGEIEEGSWFVVPCEPEVERILSAPRCKLWNDLAASIGFEQDLILMNANKSEVH